MNTDIYLVQLHHKAIRLAVVVLLPRRIHAVNRTTSFIPIHHSHVKAEICQELCDLFRNAKKKIHSPIITLLNMLIFMITSQKQLLPQYYQHQSLSNLIQPNHSFFHFLLFIIHPYLFQTIYI